MLKIRFKTVTLLFATVMILSIGAVSPAAADTNTSVPTPDYIDGASPTVDTDQPMDGAVGETSHDRFVTDRLVYDAAPEDTLPAGMDQIYAGTDNEYLNLEIEYDGSLSDSGAAVIGLDVDQRLETGTNRAELSDYDIGVDYALVAGTDGTRESVSYLLAWNERTGEFETIAAEPSSDIVASKAEPTTDTLTVAVERASIEQPDAIDFLLTQSFQDSNQDQFVPPRNEEAITYALNEDPNEFDFGIELQQDATVTTGDDTTITAYPSNNAETSVSDALLELAVDTNDDGEFTDDEVVTSQTLDFAPSEFKTSNLTYTNVQLEPGDYEYQAQISKNGQTTASYTTGTLTVSEASDQPPEETPSVIEENTVAVDGSQITINTDGANSISVSDLPTDVSISEISDGGMYNADEGSILYTDFGSGLPETVTFRLTPGDSYADGDTLDFTVGGTSVTLQVTETTLPADLKGDVTAAQYNAVAGTDNELSAPDLSAAVNGWATSGSINGVDIGAPELSALVNYWANN